MNKWSKNTILMRIVYVLCAFKDEYISLWLLSEYDHFRNSISQGCGESTTSPTSRQERGPRKRKV